MDTARRYSSGILPSLDGWRALSVGLVLFAHSNPPQVFKDEAFFCGVIGVRFFFVISGFLITWLLLRENNDRGAINLKAFYIRRAFRILPVYFMFLLTYALLEINSSKNIPLSQWIANLTFTANYSTTKGPSGHLWTLGIEEQFYLIWPVAFLLLSRHLIKHSNYRRLMLVLALVLVACPLLRGICYLIPPEHIPVLLNPFSFPRHADEIGWGCMAALWFWTKPGSWDTLDRYLIPFAMGGGG